MRRFSLVGFLLCFAAASAQANGTNYTYQWEYGTGASCAGGTTALSGAKSVVNTEVFVEEIAGPTLFNIPSANGLCILSTNPTNAGAGVFGSISYVQQ